MTIIKKLSVLACLIMGTMLHGCGLDKLVDVDNPQIGSEIDHKYLETKDGSLAMLYSSLGSLQSGVSKASFEVGTLTDELTSKPYTVGTDYYYSGSRTNADSRVNIALKRVLQKGLVFDAYNDLQTARIKASHARNFLKGRSDSSVQYAISASYSYEGYAILILAENVCSGIPMSEIPYGQKAVYGKALSTEKLLDIAISKFDSALAIDHDSSRFTVLAKTGKGRALMSLGRYAEANNAVAGIGESESYTLHYSDVAGPSSSSKPFWTSAAVRSRNQGHHIVSLEGINGLTWYTDPLLRDPRLPITIDSVRDEFGWKFSYPIYAQQRKFMSGTVIFKLASYIDSKMIEAEYLLSQNNPDWINPINIARRTVGLADTISPVKLEDKVNLLFRERAFWFYGHAVRLSDFRRLVRQYGRDASSVYPTGFYSKSEDTYSYGDAVVFVPSESEFAENYEYSGCINREP